MALHSPESARKPMVLQFAWSHCGMISPSEFSAVLSSKAPGADENSRGFTAKSRKAGKQAKSEP